MPEEFYNFVNNNRIGKVGLVETEFGFHIIKVTDKDDLALIADVVAEAVPSENTSNEIFRKATQFEMESNQMQDFEGVAKKYNFLVRPVKQIGSLEENLPGLPNQRNIVRWVFKEDSKEGDIKRFPLNRGGYVVVKLTDKLKEGLASIDEVGEEIKKIIIKNKKGELIRKQYEDVETLESLSEKLNLNIEIASAVNQKNPTLPGAGNEPYVVGTSFAINEGEHSNLVVGQNGVYKVLLIKKIYVEDLENYIKYSDKIRQDSDFNMAESVFTALESAAEIEDNRALYY